MENHDGEEGRLRDEIDGSKGFSSAVGENDVNENGSGLCLLSNIGSDAQ
jgi:hypothetical protein